ncbi:MAG: hypothetical protein GXY01_10035 [Clostridiales bacterium]|jgi:hypothetical protein|nr:hypothetical protein [Clostridiales bacterium]
MNRLDKENTSCLTAFICICFCAMSMFIALMSAIILTKETGAAAKYMVAALLFLTVLIAVFSRYGNKRNLFAPILFSTAFLLKSCFALAVNTQPESDFYLLYNAANNLAQGSRDLTADNYFFYWPYQSAFVAWMALFIKLFDADIVFFKLMNCLFSALTNLLIYMTARRFASERGARAAGIVFLLYPGTFILLTILSNQHLSEFLMLLSVYIYTSPAKSSRRKIALSAAAAVLLALGNAIRPVGALVLLAVLCYLFIRIFSWIKTSKNRLKELTIRTAVLLAVYFLVSAGLSAIVKTSGLNEYGLTNNIPEWKFIVGMNEKHDGVYNAEDEKAVFDNDGSINPDIKDLLLERMSISPSGFLKLICRKALIMWGAFEPSYWAFTDSVLAETNFPGGYDSLFNIICKVNKFTCAYYFWVNLLIASGMIIPFREKHIHEECALLLLIALIYFCAHWFIEVQSRYRSLMTMVTFPIIALGVDSLLAGVGHIKSRNQ